MEKMAVRKYILFMVSVLAVMVLLYLFFPQLYIKIVTNRAEELERAIVTFYDAGDASRCIEIKEKPMLDKLYDLIKSTADTKVYRHPRHSIVISADTRYEIQLFYADGSVDRLRTPEKPDSVYRLLENESHGYIIGENKALERYIAELRT